MTPSFTFWQKWLQWTAILAAVFGAILAFAYPTPLFQWMRTPIDAAFFDAAAQVTPAMHAQQAFLVSLLGALMAAWCVMLAFLAHYPFARREPWAWTCLAVALLTWFVLDESFSLYYQVYFNAIFNLVFLGILGLPLYFTRAAFQR